MSLVNGAGERIYLEAKPNRVQAVREPAIRARNVAWLQIQRKLGLSIGETARLIRTPRATVDAGVRWAMAEEERLEQESIATEQPPVLDEASGLDLDDVLYLIDQYPPGSGIGSIPEFREFMARMVGRIEALGYDVRPLTVALAGAA